ncbi:DNA-binding response regulator [Streptacidiphilus pinicola]|uniref:DNA-binding response regulator n=1 Tax=Streptacidiphilus pinicola TaxID=2219663 RepID=A0A2X0JZL1_9ACTN|nr:response regulator transcription factor [Streptacidiphilus pinicola]RAG82395.1 DNA-binding response regulator [Streptacidiphilus pinicola]
MTLVATERVAPANTSEDRCQLQRVLIADEHELVQAGLRAVLMDEPWVASCLGAGSAELAWQVARRHQPQLALVSTSLGGRSGLELCRAFKERMPYVRVVLVSGEGRVSAALASTHGAVASLSKQMPSAAIVSALKRVAEGARVFPRDEVNGAVQLSKRELDVLQHLVLGLSNPEVAALLNLSRHTVKQHTSTVYRKLGVRNRAQAASRAQELGLVA